MSRFAERAAGTCEHHSATPAARPAGVDILAFGVKEEHPTVVVAGPQGHTILPEEVENDAFPQAAQVAGDNEIIEIRARPVSSKWARRVEYAAGAMAAPMLLASVMPLSMTFPVVTWVT